MRKETENIKPSHGEISVAGGCQEYFLVVLPQHFPNNNNFRTSRGLDGFINRKLRTHEEDKSDIGTRKAHPISNGQSPETLNRLVLVNLRRVEPAQVPSIFS